MRSAFPTIAVVVLLATSLSPAAPNPAPPAPPAEPAKAPAAESENWKVIAKYFEPPAEFAGKFGDYRSPLLFDDGSPVKTPGDWQRLTAVTWG